MILSAIARTLYSPITGFDLVFVTSTRVVLTALALVLVALAVGAYLWRRRP